MKMRHLPLSHPGTLVFVIFALFLQLPSIGAETRPSLLRTIDTKHTIWTLAFSPNGKVLASGSKEGTIKLWDVLEGKNVFTFPGHNDSFVYSVVFSPDGKMLASGGSDMTIKLWDVARGRLTKTLQGHKSVITSLSFSPDGKTLASGSGDATIKFWDVSTGNNTATLDGHVACIQSLTIASDGKLLASGSSVDHASGINGKPSIKLWDMKTRKCFATLDQDLPEITSLAFSPNNKTLVSGTNGVKILGEKDKPAIIIWDIATLKNVAKLTGHRKSVLSVVFSPDGKIMASGGDDHAVIFWDIDSGKITANLRKHTKRVVSVVFSPNGKILASGGEDQSIVLWDVEPPKSDK